MPANPAAPRGRHALPGTLPALDYEGHPIRHLGALLSLTDMWRAAGGPGHRRPSDWLLLEETRRLRAHVAAPSDRLFDPEPPNAGPAGIWPAPHDGEDGLVVATHGQGGGTWAHWQLALSYGRTLSPPFHLWCNTVVRDAMTRPDAAPAPDHDPVRAYLAGAFQRLHRRLDTLERHAADHMFLQVSTKELLFGQRRDFSQHSRGMMLRAIAAEPYRGLCPCCGATPVLDAEGLPVPGAEFDHAFHRGLNRPEAGWLICGACHDELTHGGYLVRHTALEPFRRFQAAVLAQRPRPRPRLPRPIQPLDLSAE